jgi:hypothetical protein
MLATEITKIILNYFTSAGRQAGTLPCLNNSHVKYIYCESFVIYPLKCVIRRVPYALTPEIKRTTPLSTFWQTLHFALQHNCAQGTM